MSYFRIGGAALLCMLFANQVLAEEKRRVIEEMVVTAEKRESTVSDTSISITAFGEDMLEDFGIQAQTNSSTSFLQPLETPTIFVSAVSVVTSAQLVVTQVSLRITTVFIQKISALPHLRMAFTTLSGSKPCEGLRARCMDVTPSAEH